MLARAPIKTSNPFVALTARRGSVTDARSKPLDSSTTPTNNEDKKKKKKKKKKAVAASDENPDELSSDNQLQQAAELSLPQRLEIAAAHSDLHAALVGLVGWSRLYINTDAILSFFQCNALPLLLVNVLSNRVKTETIYENLTTFLENCLYVERNGKSRTSNIDVAAAFVRSVRVVAQQFSPQKNGAVEDEKVEESAVEHVASALSELVVQYRLSLNGLNVEASLSQQVLAIEAKLAAAAAKDSAVTGQAIKDSFQRRDIRSEALVLYDSRLATITQLVQEYGTRSNEKLVVSPLTGDSNQADNEVVIDEEETRVKSEMSKLIADKAKKLTPIKTKLRDRADHLLSLQQQRDELEAKLRAVNEQIETTIDEQQALKEQVDEVETEFLQTHAPLVEQHEQIMRRDHRRQCLAEVHRELRKLEDTIHKIADKHSETQSLEDKQSVCLRQQLEGLMRYLSSEMVCVQFMTNRANEAEEKMDKLLEEARGYEAVGVSAVAQELMEKAEALRPDIEEDRLCVAALKQRDMEVAAMVDRIFQDPIQKPVLASVDEVLKKEVLRHVEFIKKLHSSEA